MDILFLLPGPALGVGQSANVIMGAHAFLSTPDNMLVFDFHSQTSREVVGVSPMLLDSVTVTVNQPSGYCFCIKKVKSKATNKENKVLCKFRANLWFIVAPKYVCMYVYIYIFDWPLT